MRMPANSASEYTPPPWSHCRPIVDAMFGFTVLLSDETSASNV